jgi:hypothetical protein
MEFNLTPNELETLRRYQRNVSGKKYVKVTCILMLGKGYFPACVSECPGIDASTVYRYRSSSVFRFG